MISDGMNESQQSTPSAPNLEVVANRESLHRYQLDHHTLGRVSPLGYQWVHDCYAHGTWWAGVRLRAPQFTPQLRLFRSELWVRHDPGPEIVDRRSIDQCMRVARHFESKWKWTRRWNRYSVDDLVRPIPDRQSLIARLQHVRVYMVRIWRLHFLFQFALRQLFNYSLRHLPQGVQDEHWIDALSGWQDASRAYILEGHRISNSLTYEFRSDDAKARIVESFIRRRGNRIIRDLDVSEETLLERPDLFRTLFPSSLSRNLEPATRPPYVVDGSVLDAVWKANYIWWSEEHNAAIEWKSLIPLRTSAHRASDFLEIPHSDIFFMAWPELIDSLRRGGVAPEVGARLLRRRYGWRCSSPPNGASESVTEWKGSGVGAGVARGPALVCSNGRLGDTVDTGFVLVATGVSPSWLPLIARASACVLVHASLASHGSILCRQLGIPCVVGVDPGIMSTRAGATLTVDATRGIVKRMNHGEDASTYTKENH